MVQEVEQTHEEKVNMYMKCDKKELINMLIESNKHLKSIKLIEASVKNIHDNTKPIEMFGSPS